MFVLCSLLHKFTPQCFSDLVLPFVAVEDLLGLRWTCRDLQCLVPPQRVYYLHKVTTTSPVYWEWILRSSALTDGSYESFCTIATRLAYRRGSLDLLCWARQTWVKEDVLPAVAYDQWEVEKNWLESALVGDLDLYGFVPVTFVKSCNL